MKDTNKELSVKEIFDSINRSKKYLFSKWKIILIISLFSSLIGLTISLIVKPKFKSSLSFVIEEEASSSAGGLASLASSFGLGSAASEGGLFSTSNMLEFLKTRSLIEKTLLSKVDEKHKDNLTFAQLYINETGLKQKWNDNPNVNKISYEINQDRSEFSKTKDSLLFQIFTKITKDELSVSQPNEDNSFIVISLKTKSESFSKLFSSKLIEVVSEYYIKSKTQKAKQNVQVIQKQVDSVRVELFNAISGLASANDNAFALNPSMNIKRVPSAKKQVDVQANTAILTELVKNLELTKMTLLNQTPFIQVIDKPIYPLEIEKIGKVLGILIGLILGGFIGVVYVLIKRVLIK